MFRKRGESLLHSGEAQDVLSARLSLKDSTGVSATLVGLRSRTRIDGLKTCLACGVLVRGRRRVRLALSPDIRDLIIMKERLVRFRPQKTTTVSLYSIEEIRLGQRTLGFDRFGRGGDEEARSFSVISAAGVFNFVLDPQDHESLALPELLLTLVQLARDGTLDLRRGVNTGLEGVQLACWINHFRSSRRNRERAELTGQELASLLRRVGTKHDCATVLAKYGSAGSLSESSFLQYVARELTLRPAAEAAYERALNCDGLARGDWLGCAGLERFLKAQQGDGSDQFDVVPAAAVMEAYGDGHGRLSRQAFARYLCSEELNSAIAPPHVEDGSAPLSEYLCSSSHNTYLHSDQIFGASSVEPYISALRRGYRCVEIDCWDGLGGSPMVTHGLTMTESVPLVEVLGAIAIEAFSTAADTGAERVPFDWPVIISLENRCGARQQRVVAAQMRDKLGERLLLPSDAKVGGLPSLRSLRGRFIVKAAIGPQVTEPELAALVYLRIKPFESTHFSGGSSELESRCMLNLPEAAVLAGGCASNVDACKAFNEGHMTRVYPSGGRISSSNMDPLPTWARGCQLVALNAQKSCTATRINAAVFRHSGGFIRKSRVLQDGGNRGGGAVVWSIRVLSGHSLPPPYPASSTSEPFVEVSLGHILDEETAATSATKAWQAARTSKCSGEHFKCDWSNDAPLVLHSTRPRSAVVVFAVRNPARCVASTGCLALRLRPGLRVLKLEGRDGHRLPEGCELLVEIRTARE